MTCPRSHNSSVQALGMEPRPPKLQVHWLRHWATLAHFLLATVEPYTTSPGVCRQSNMMYLFLAVSDMCGGLYKHQTWHGPCPQRIKVLRTQKEREKNREQGKRDPQPSKVSRC